VGTMSAEKALLRTVVTVGVVTGLLFAVVVFAAVAAGVRTEYRIRSENAKGLELVRKAGGTIYMMRGGMIRGLDATTGTWGKVDLPGELYGHRRDEMTIRDGLVYAVDNGCGIVVFSVDGKLVKTIDVAGGWGIHGLCLSPDGKRLAFTAEFNENRGDRRLCMCHLESGKIDEIPNTDGLWPNAMTWDASGEALYCGITTQTVLNEDSGAGSRTLSDTCEVIRLDIRTGERVKVDDGWWPERMPDGTLSYWQEHGNGYVCCVRNIESGHEQRLGLASWSPGGIAWSPSGRYAAAGVIPNNAVPMHFWRFDFLPPAVWDSQTGEMHRLPESGLVYAKGIYWDRSYDEVRQERSKQAADLMDMMD
jgi:hypothetical protein